MIFLYVKVAVMAVFVCFFGDVFGMEADGASYVALAGNGDARDAGKTPARYSSLRDETPTQEDITALEQAFLKMLNVRDGETEFYYSVQAIINPGSGTKDQRIQKYVNKWCIKPEHEKWLTEKRLGESIRKICSGKKIDLSKILTWAAGLGDIHVVRVMLAAGASISSESERYIKSWARTDCTGCWKELLGNHEE